MDVAGVARQDVGVDTPHAEHMAEAMLRKREDMDINPDTHLHPPPTMDEGIHQRHIAATSPNCMQIGIFAGRVDTT